MEISVNVHGDCIKGIRRIEDVPVQKDEKVNVCIFLAYTYGNDSMITPIRNANINAEESVII